MLLLKRIIAICLALILSIAPARAVLGPESFPAAFDEMLKVASLANPAVIIIDGTTGQIVYGKNINSQRKPASIIILLTAAVTLDYLDQLQPYIHFVKHQQ
jgi:D-alanyl-D-alanine carboxypeptidase